VAEEAGTYPGQEKLNFHKIVLSASSKPERLSAHPAAEARAPFDNVEPPREPAGAL